MWHFPAITLTAVYASYALGGLGALLVTYWVNPMTAWIVLGSSFTLVVAFKVRQREEAEGALQTVDE